MQCDGRRTDTGPLPACQCNGASVELKSGGPPGPAAVYSWVRPAALCIGVGNGGHRGALPPQKIAAPYIFKAASLIHVHPECPPNQIMFLHQCFGYLYPILDRGGVHGPPGPPLDPPLPETAKPRPPPTARAHAATTTITTRVDLYSARTRGRSRSISADRGSLIMVNLRRFPAWCSAAACAFSVHYTSRSTFGPVFGQYRSLFYTLATCVDVHEPQTAN